MPNYIIAYHGGKKPESPEEGAKHMEKWKAWIDSIGDAVVNPGTPLIGTKILTSTKIQDDNDPNSMKGFAVVKAENIEAAIEISKSDPFLDMGGTIRISEMMEIPK